MSVKYSTSNATSELPRRLSSSRMTRIAALSLALGMLMAASAFATKLKKVRIVRSSDLGAYLADAVGRPLYRFSKDQQGHNRQGNGADPPMASCYGRCQRDWPPATNGHVPGATAPLNKSKLGVSMRNEGTMQVIYDGWPLYYFSKEDGSAKPTGQNVTAYGGTWHLVRPTGSKREQ
jgi:predicted lipoprotein with Yx(FWY)xxD motif